MVQVIDVTHDRKECLTIPKRRELSGGSVKPLSARTDHEGPNRLEIVNLTPQDIYNYPCKLLVFDKTQSRTDFFQEMPFCYKKKKNLYIYMYVLLK